MGSKQAEGGRPILQRKKKGRKKSWVEAERSVQLDTNR